VASGMGPGKGNLCKLLDDDLSLLIRVARGHGAGPHLC
jgi:hypothetical protein